MRKNELPSTGSLCLPYRLLLRGGCVFAQDLLHLRVRCHVLVHAAVHTRGLANAQLWLLVKSDALAEALLSHPADTPGGRFGLGERAAGGAREAKAAAHLLNMSVIASSSLCCAACMAVATWKSVERPRSLRSPEQQARRLSTAHRPFLMVGVLWTVVAANVLPMITRLQHEHGGSLSVHTQRYASVRTNGALGRVLQQQEVAEALTDGNTRPMRVRLDTASLYEGSAPEYSACFSVGQWFRRGLPESQNPPEDGVATCERGGSTIAPAASLTSGCWGRCLVSDVLLPADRERMIDVMTDLVAELTTHFAVRPVANLSFAVSSGEYERALHSRGYDLPPACASDCTVLSGAAVDPRYCTNGRGLAYDYDVVVSVTKPPALESVAGTGSACAFDQLRRPLWLVLAWHSETTGLHELSKERAIRENRAFVRHELLHGLGFVNSMFFYARDSRGARKNLIELRPVRDEDGAIDEVWHFVRGRAYELAQLYFSCDGNATADAAERTWDGLPLMGLPEAGRGAHWETRIMRDDVMSYGFREMISSITLAAMEDLGHYVANYSAAQCMSWGRNQGCDYVRSRCGRGSHDGGATFAPPSQSACRGDPFWALHPDGYLGAKCGGGNDPCISAAGSGYESGVTLADGSDGARCDAQCHFGPGAQRDGCTTPPTDDVEGTSTVLLDGLRDQLGAERWEAWLVPAIWLVSLLAIGPCVRSLLCPSGGRSRVIAYTLCAALLLISLGGLVGASFLFVEHATYAAFVGLPTVYALAALCAAVLLFTMIMLLALAWHADCTLRLGFWVLLILIVLEVLGILLVVYWIYSLGAVPSDALNSMLGEARLTVDSVLSQPVSVAEGLVCTTYQTCCRDDALAIIDHAQEGDTGVDEGSGVAAAIGAIAAASSGELGSGDWASGDVRQGTVPRTARNSSHCLAPPQHEGATSDLELSLRDPSTPNFCAYTSGAPAALLIAPPPATCQLVQTLAAADGFSLSSCRSDFCRTGTDGYLAFLRLFTELIRRYALPLSAFAAALVLVQLVLAFNLRSAGQHARRRAAKHNAQKQRTNKKGRDTQQFDSVLVEDRLVAM